MFLKSSQWIMKWWYHWKPFYPGFTWYVGPTSHKSSGAVIWLVGVGPTHLPRLSLQSHVTWDPRPTISRVGPTSHESSGAVIWLVGVGPTHHHTSHESFDVVTWRVGPTHRPTRAGGSLYNCFSCTVFDGSHDYSIILIYKWPSFLCVFLYWFDAHSEQRNAQQTVRCRHQRNFYQRNEAT